MIVLPAMDLIGGRCVRLAQGRFDDATIYSGEPIEAVLSFQEKGAEWVHIVDLDGAREGRPVQHELIARIAGAADVNLQVAGGIREEAQLTRLFEAGVARVVIGSLAVKQPELVRSFLDRFGPDRITLALDVNIVDGEPMVAVSGWTETSRQSLWDVAAFYPDARHLLATDIGRDGMMSGPNITLLAETVRRLPHLAVQVSGGVSSLDDLDRSAKAGAAGAIVGKALWEGKIDLGEALARARA
ncbi:1-(5-phosphoribosyl)-5-[(5-phosphoribosylamino)methylideneamino]imidazole-4-carboxamide isomerase [Sphingosinicella rhizophila]|uniref:1-(5-phosphoribosyl)-5-[(5-phosphoribosylamino)methylideneamino] imidazole-4-carboxamide isomerase n=1 Tax=Sphingosinicella rhizophila TaxID=3050082 RepID=A0ABU3Q2X8_9SPHN|nr:1-(5-phosphoribosyl)-5-[(5-phosphoribosylamino)methylideneamino]imidazole-4-carboxamide isomerase [Sphingosinicella sp. GR2756]MDT9597343.1 1-(5-phosphoribosyl)-5-[(5-phosphoribosylamino)methylideneamino]imidazole-4-carboxamide isomerase [Sphingosinicella sp. GR2756]